jgi:hypothetical protein
MRCRDLHVPEHAPAIDFALFFSALPFITVVVIAGTNMLR